MKLKIMIVFVLLISMTASSKNKDDKGKDKKEEGSNNEIKMLTKFEKIGIWGYVKVKDYNNNCEVLIEPEDKEINFS